MLILPRGITGFSIPKKHLMSDPGDFRAACWEVVATRRGRVEDRPQVIDARSTSFFTLVLVLPSVEVTAMLNKVHPWLGFCRPMVPGVTRPEFVESGRVGASFAALGRYRVLFRDELEQPVGESMGAELGRGELIQLKYWSKLTEPARLRVGDVVFNFWD